MPQKCGTYSGGAPSKRESLTEIEAANVRIGDDLGRKTMGEHFAGMDDVGPVDQAECFAHIVIRYQNADAALGEMAHKLLDVGDSDWVDAGKRLIQEHVAGAACQCPGNFQPAALAP